MSSLQESGPVESQNLKFLKNVKQLLSALYKLPEKQHLSKTPLSKTELNILLNSVVEIDKDGNLVSEKTRRKTSNSSENSWSRRSSVFRKPSISRKLSHVTSTPRNSETVQKSVRQQFNPRIFVETTPNWLKPQTERHGAKYTEFINELEHRATEGTKKLTKLGRLKKDFENTKSRLQKERESTISELKKLKDLRLKNKFSMIDYGHELSLVTEVSLKKLRTATELEVKGQMIDEVFDSPEWFRKLEDFKEVGDDDEVLTETSKFCRHPIKNGDFRKSLDRLCYLMNCMTLQVVMDSVTFKAFKFVIEEVLGLPEHIYSHWIRVRTGLDSFQMVSK